MQCLKSAISNLSKRNISCILYIYDQKCTNYMNLKKTILIFEVNTLNIAQILISKCKVLCKNKGPYIWNRKYFVISGLKLEISGQRDTCIILNRDVCPKFLSLGFGQIPFFCVGNFLSYFLGSCATFPLFFWV